MISNGLRRLVMLVTVALFLGLVPCGAAAQEPVRFLIETITVEGVQRATARRIVADESLLNTGESYSEGELRQAVYRVKRLPFVVDAEFSLRKGSERGAYELVITVEETKALFFSAAADAQSVQRLFPDGRRERDTAWRESGSVGGRYFVGSYGLAFGSVTKTKDQDGELLQAGYTRYNLFGAGSFASLALSTETGIEDSDDLQAALTVGVPLTATQSLRSTVSWFRVENVFRVGVVDAPDAIRTERHLDALQASLAWIYDTTDDPLFPLTGVKVTAGGTYSSAETSFRSQPPLEFDGTTTEHFADAFASGQRNWALTARQSVFLGLDTGYRRNSGDGFAERALVGGLAIGHSVNLWGRLGDVRFENRVQESYVHVSPRFDGDDTFDRADFVSSLSWRSRWGLVSASFTYLGLWGDE
jgi:hypothetical protein